MRIGMYGLYSAYWPTALANAVKGVSGARLVAAAHLGCDPERTRAIMGKTPREYAEELGIALYEDPEEMVRQEGVEGLCISGPHTLLPDYCVHAAALGCHFYVAKPMAVNLTGADRIVRAVEQAGVVAVSGMTERYDPAIRAAWHRIQAGEIGSVIAIRALHQHGRLNFHAQDWWKDPEQGGPELSLMWYVADVCRWLAGSEVVRVYAEYGTFNSPGSPFMDNGKAIFRHANGMISSVDIYFSCDFEFPNWEVEIMGTEGALRTQQTAYPLTVFTRFGPRGAARPSHPMLLEEVWSWVAACLGVGEPFMTIRDARQVMEVCFAARLSAQTHRVVELPLSSEA